MAYESQTAEQPIDAEAQAPATNQGGSAFKITDLPGIDNIATLLPDDRLTEIATLVWDEYVIDKKSREDKEAEWEKAAEAFSLKREAKNFPFDKASNVKFPVLLNAAIQFAARASAAVIHDGKVAKGKVIGKDDGGAKQQQADRVAAYLNYQTLERDSIWSEEQDQLLHQLPIFGTAFKKIYRDPVYGNRAELVSCRDLVVNASCPSLERAPRCTQRFDLYPHEITERKLDGRFLPIDYIYAEPPAVGDEKEEKKYADYTDKSAPHEMLEQHRLIDLDDDGYAEPYIVTLHSGSKKIARIVASYDERDIVLNAEKNTVARINRRKVFVKYPFIPDPDGGIYDIGLGKLLNDTTETINSVMNQIIDAGTLQTAGGGFIGKEFRLKSGTMEMTPGKYKQVPFAGNDIRTAIYSMEHPGPSAVLFQVLGLLIDWTEKIAASPEVLAGQAPTNQPATTTLAMIEQGLKVFTGIIGRVLRALGAELKVMYDLNARYMSQQEYIQIGDDQQAVSRQDFNIENADVIPVADATVVTDMQKMARAEMLLPFFADPMINPHEARKRYFEAAGIPIAGLLNEPQPPSPEEQEAIALQLADIKAKIEKTQSETMKNLVGAELEAQQALVQQAMSGLNALQELFGGMGNEGNGGAIPGMDGGAGDGGVSGIPEEDVALLEAALAGQGMGQPVPDGGIPSGFGAA